MLIFKETSFLAASHLISFLFIHISSGNYIQNSLYKLLCRGRQCPELHVGDIWREKILAYQNTWFEIIEL